MWIWDLGVLYIPFGFFFIHHSRKVDPAIWMRALAAAAALVIVPAAHGAASCGPREWKCTWAVAGARPARSGPRALDGTSLVTRA